MARDDETEAEAIDALDLLTEDHERVQELFDEYDELRGDESTADERADLAELICGELAAHTQLEEELFYPAVQDEIDEADAVNEALVEHASAKDLIEQIHGMDPGDDMLDATVKVLGEYVKHHVTEEQDRLFALVTAAGIDTEELGRQLAERRAELREEMGLDVGDDEDLEEEEDDEEEE